MMNDNMLPKHWHVGHYMNFMCLHDIRIADPRESIDVFFKLTGFYNYKFLDEEDVRRTMVMNYFDIEFVGKAGSPNNLFIWHPCSGCTNPMEN